MDERKPLPAGAGIYVAPAQKGAIMPPGGGWRALRPDAGALPAVTVSDGDECEPPAA